MWGQSQEEWDLLGVELGADVDLGWLGVQRVLVQRWRCQGCGHELVSPERTRQAEARQAWWRQVKRLIAFSRISPTLIKNSARPRPQDYFPIKT
jgi:hypothetical protein